MLPVSPKFPRHDTSGGGRHDVVWLLLIAVGFSAGCRMSASGHNVDGVRSLQMGNQQDAIRSFQQALNRDPNNADAYYNLAAVYHEIGRKNPESGSMDEAEGLYHQCLDRDRDHVECHRGLAALLVQTERSESAFTLLERWSDRSPKLADPRIELARLHEEFGDKDAATRFLADALNVEPQNARAWTAPGNLREQQGQVTQALSNYQQAYRLNPLKSELAVRIARIQRDISTGTTDTAPGETRLVNTPATSPTR